jgi:holo-[acyl-carrier protein] synthase
VTIRVGIDVVPVERVARLAAADEGILDRAFSAREQAYCLSKPRRRYEHLAARFAAKEAVLKAFGTGLGRRMRWTDVEVVSTGGRPRIELHGEVAAIARLRCLVDLDVTISHTSELAVAHAITVWEAAPCAST